MRTGDKILAFVYFVGYEVFLYLALSYLLFDQIEKNPDESQAIIVQNWNSFVYFILLYAAITIGTLLLLTSALPRKQKPRVMTYFWLSWLGLLIMLVLAFS
ncbi:MAG: hypothetical protein JWQ14_1012 [Adhaeribacter sp.]|jgi:hypothetical protein|nr:hypothetical protein [Adhaeribacter sp.]